MKHAWFISALPSIVLFVAGTLPAHATHIHTGQEFRIGVLQHDTTFMNTRHESGTDINLEWIGPLFSFPQALQLYQGFGLRPEFGYTGNFGLTGARTQEIYTAMGFDLLPFDNREFRLSLGFAAHNGYLHRGHKHRLALGQRVLFYASFELGYWWHQYGLFVFYQHSSNGFLPGPNDGINEWGLRAGYRL